MLDTVDFNHVQHISFTQSRLTDAVSVILSELLSYEHPPKGRGGFCFHFMSRRIASMRSVHFLSSLFGLPSADFAASSSRSAAEMKAAR